MLIVCAVTAAAVAGVAAAGSHAGHVSVHEAISRHSIG